MLEWKVAEKRRMECLKKSQEAQWLMVKVWMKAVAEENPHSS